MDFITQYIQPQLLIIAVFLWCIGLFLKKSPLFNLNWAIPFILLAIGIFTTILYLAINEHNGFTAEVFINGTIQGVMLAALSVFGNELGKQFITRKKE